MHRIYLGDGSDEGVIGFQGQVSEQVQASGFLTS